jgi:hypothetical protein
MRPYDCFAEAARLRCETTERHFAGRQKVVSPGQSTFLAVTSRANCHQPSRPKKVENKFPLSGL